MCEHKLGAVVVVVVFFVFRCEAEKFGLSLTFSAWNYIHSLH